MSDTRPSTATTEAHAPGYTPPSYEHIVETYGLDILKGGVDFSVENGGLALTKDMDIKLGDTVHNALFRFAEGWRLNAPHLQFLFELMTSMQARRKLLDDKMNKAGEGQKARFDINNYPASDAEFIAAFHEIIDEQGAAEYGFATYAGCVVLLLSGSLLRFKNDLDATRDDWANSPPTLTGIPSDRSSWPQPMDSGTTRMGQDTAPDAATDALSGNSSQGSSRHPGSP